MLKLCNFVPELLLPKNSKRSQSLILMVFLILKFLLKIKKIIIKIQIFLETSFLHISYKDIILLATTKSNLNAAMGL